MDDIELLLDGISTSVFGETSFKKPFDTVREAYSQASEFFPNCSVSETETTKAPKLY